MKMGQYIKVNNTVNIFYSQCMCIQRM